MTAAMARDPAGSASTAIAGVPLRRLFQGLRIGEPLSHSHAARQLQGLGSEPAVGAARRF